MVHLLQTYLFLLQFITSTIGYFFPNIIQSIYLCSTHHINTYYDQTTGMYDSVVAYV